MADGFLESYGKDPSWTLGSLVAMRDPKSKRSKTVCRECLFALWEEYPEDYEEFIRIYFQRACWNDALYVYRSRILAYPDCASHPEMELLASAILSGDVLAAKWAPSEGSRWDRPPLCAAKVLRRILGMSPREYRHTLTELRKNLLEVQMSQGRYDEVDIPGIPKTAWGLSLGALGRPCNNKGEVSEARERLSQRFHAYASGVCVIAYDGYFGDQVVCDFVSQVARLCVVGHFRNKMIRSPMGGDIVYLVYEFLLGQVLLYDISELPKNVYVISEDAVVGTDRYDEVCEMYERHSVGMPNIVHLTPKFLESFFGKA